MFPYEVYCTGINIVCVFPYELYCTGFVFVCMQMYTDAFFNVVRTVVGASTMQIGLGEIFPTAMGVLLKFYVKSKAVLMYVLV